MGKRSLFFLLVAAALLLASVPAMADMGVGLEWNGDFTPNMVLPIKMESGLIIEPMFGFDAIDSGEEDEEGSLAAGMAQSVYSLGGTVIRVGLSVEKDVRPDDAVGPIFGANVRFHLNSPDDPPESVGLDYDSYTDILLAVYLGGRVTLAENFTLSGQWGPYVELMGERSVTDTDTDVTITTDSRTNFGSVAWAKLRWTGLWGK